MQATRIGLRFFNSTRGQIVQLLRGMARTVEELSDSLNLTDNAVRAHLTTLERDGLVRQAGARRGARKPHFTYALTREAEDLFPKPYAALFNVLLNVLKEKHSSEEMIKLLREVGRNLARDKIKGQSNGSHLSVKARHAVGLLENLGGVPRLEEKAGKFFIQSTSCPLATAVEMHPEVCSLAETLLAQATGTRVRESCNRMDTPPRCSFELTQKKKRKIGI